MHRTIFILRKTVTSILPNMDMTLHLAVRTHGIDSPVPPLPQIKVLPRITILVNIHDRAIITISEAVIDTAYNELSVNAVGIQEPAPLRVIVPTPKIVQPSLLIEDIPAIPKGIQRAQRAGESASLADLLAPCIVQIGYHFCAGAVKEANDVALKVILVGIRCTIEQRHRRLVLGRNAREMLCTNP